MNLEDRAREFAGKFYETNRSLKFDTELQCMAEFAQAVADEAVKAEQKRVADLIVERTATVMDIVEMRHSINDVLSDLHTRRHDIAQLRNGETK